MDIKDTAKAKIIIGKGGSGSNTYRLTLRTSWMKEMGIDESDREVELLFDGEKIIIKKGQE